jgi:hypothetical protein
VERREITREKKAEAAAEIDKKVKNELVERLKKVTNHLLKFILTIFIGNL